MPNNARSFDVVEKREKDEMNGQEISQLRVSVILPTFRREASLLRTVRSMARSKSIYIEVIVVDMGGLSSNFIGLLEKIEMESGIVVNILKGNENMYVSGAINLALPYVNNELVLISSDDVVLEDNTIHTLVDVLRSFNDIGIICPLCYYLRDKRRIWWAGSKFNFYTGTTKFYGVNQPLPSDKLFDSDTFTTLALIKKELFYDENRKKLFFVDQNEFPIHYEEVDFSFRIKEKGWRICVSKNAKIYHDVPTKEEGDTLRIYGVHTPNRAYFSARNKVIFHKKHSKTIQFLVFILFFCFIFVPYYSDLILRRSKEPFERKIQILRYYLNGVKDGLSWPRISK